MNRAADHAASIAAWARTSRFHALGAVLDLQDPDTPELLRRIQSADALDAVRLARRQGLRFVVLGGQLLRKKAGCFAALARHAEALPLAAMAAAERIGEAGESCSLWFLLCDDEPRQAVMSALAAVMDTEGNA
ncbi:MAG: hypothetical protein IPK42_02125 [Betaproteobacteria bacterium]|nr:hypothetical protein [Betaproteobacteria bacterium]